MSCQICYLFRNLTPLRLAVFEKRKHEHRSRAFRVVRLRHLDQQSKARQSPKMVVLAALALFVVASILSIAYWYLSEPRNLPPGPPGLPLLGSTLKVLDVNEQQAFLFDCVEKYGPIFKLYIANKLVIILGDHESIQEAMVKQGEIFSGRPQLYSFMPTRCRHLGNASCILGVFPEKDVSDHRYHRLGR